jgi:hypothetical protein
VSRWQRYWFDDGGRIALAIVRIAVALAVLLTLSRVSRPAFDGDLPGSSALYRPIGVWMVLGHHAPPDVLVDMLWVIAWASTVAMLVGLVTRISTAVSFVSAVALASLVFAGKATWSHQYNVVFLAQLAMLGGRAGDALSADALIRKLRKLPPVDVARGYQWSLRLVQLAVALMFACAAWHKILHGHFTLRWALSDSLRNHLLVVFDLSGIPRTGIADWIIDDPWKYRTAAMLNLVSQATPILAVIFVRRPLVRAVAGAFFVIETVALDQVVDLWNPHWLPLVAVFVDWEALLERFVRLPASPPVPEAWKPPRATRIFIAAFVIYDAFTAFVPAVDQWLNTYPFSGFPMFATVRARPPYDEHLSYALVGDHFEVIADAPVADNVQRWFDHTNRGLHAVRDPKRLQAKLAAVLGQAQRRYPDAKIRGVRLWVTIFEAPPAPEPAHFEPHPIAILGESFGDRFRTLVGTARFEGDMPSTEVEPKPVGLDVDGATLEVFHDNLPEPVAAGTIDRCSAPPRGAARPGEAGACDHGRWVLGASFVHDELDGDPLYYVAKLRDGTRWLVASHEDWHWN